MRQIFMPRQQEQRCVRLCSGVITDIALELVVIAVRFDIGSNLLAVVTKDTLVNAEPNKPMQFYNPIKRYPAHEL